MLINARRRPGKRGWWDENMVLFSGCVSRTKLSTVAMTSDAGAGAGASVAGSKWHNRGHEPIETPCGVDAGIDARWRNLLPPGWPLCLPEPESELLFREIFVSRSLP